MSQEQEIRLALTSIKERLQQGVKPEEILVLVRKLADYQGLVRSFAEYGIPCRLPQAADLKGQPLTDFFTKLLAAAKEKWDLAQWQALFRCPLMEVLYRTDRENWTCCTPRNIFPPPAASCPISSERNW